MMKPKAQTPHDEGLLEYLEDLIGTNRYVESIEKKGQEVETMNEERGGTIHSFIHLIIYIEQFDYDHHLILSPSISLPIH